MERPPANNGAERIPAPAGNLEEVAARNEAPPVPSNSPEELAKAEQIREKLSKDKTGNDKIENHTSGGHGHHHDNLIVTTGKVSRGLFGLLFSWVKGGFKKAAASIGSGGGGGGAKKAPAAHGGGGGHH